MDDVTLLQECVVKEEEIKEPLCDTFKNGEHYMLGKNSDEMNSPVAVRLQANMEIGEAEELEVKPECRTSELPMLEQNEAEEEELKPLAVVYIKTEVETDEETDEQDHLATCLPTDCKEWDGKSPLLRVRNDEAAEPGAEAGISTWRTGGQAAAKEMQAEVEDVSGSNKAETPSEEHEASKPANKDISKHSNKRPFAGTRCSETFQDKKALEEHERDHREVSQLFTRDTCQRQFTDQKVLASHTRAHTKEHEKETKFPCETCGKEFKSENCLQIHLCVRIGEKQCVCDHCGKRFKNGSTLSRHCRKHTGEQPYSCSVCNKRFAHKSALVMHTRRHLNIGPIECKECGKTFEKKWFYNVHLRVHTKEKPYKCSVCSRTFSLMCNLNRHMFIHNREPKKISECEVCGESFKTTYMNVHMRTHTGEKPYTCRFCNRTFAHSSDRLRHEKAHSEGGAVQCRECGIFSPEEEHERHMLSHTGQKPYQCGYCKKTFANSKGRWSHEVTHTREYPYNCAECGKGYRYKGLLVKHIQSHGN